MQTLTFCLAACLAALQVAAQFNCYENLYFSSLKHGCLTASAFCNRLVAPPAKATEYFRPHTNHFTTTITLSKIYTNTITVHPTPGAKVKTITTIFNSTVGKKTKTVAGCIPYATCGAVSISDYASVSEACSCVLQSTKRITLPVETSYTKYFYHHTTHTTVTPTVYKISTKTVATRTKKTCTGVAPPERTCSNAGFQYARYTLSEEDQMNALNPWNLDYYKTLPPNSTGSSLKEIAGYAASYREVVIDDYNQCGYDFMNIRGYLYAPQTGPYQWHFPAVDSLALLWIGETAYTAYNQSNVFLSSADSTYAAPYDGPYRREGVLRSIHLEAGNYYPFRIAWACLYYGFDFYMNIRRPDGRILEGQFVANDDEYYPPFSDYNQYPGPADKSTKYFVQFGCGAAINEAPMFPPYGDEVS